MINNVNNNNYINPLHSEPFCGLPTGNSATAFLKSVQTGIVSY